MYEPSHPQRTCDPCHTRRHSSIANLFFVRCAWLRTFAVLTGLDSVMVWANPGGPGELMEPDGRVVEFAVPGKIAAVAHPCRSSEAFAHCLGNPPASNWIRSRTRRWIEMFLALTALLLCAVPALFLAVCIRLTSRGPALFTQQRVGMKGRLFTIYKFRSMAAAGSRRTPGLTRAGEKGVTLPGRLMRKFKLDELPQFWNILRGDMSLVGPRPKLPRYAALQNMTYRPGITGAATVVFCREEELFASIDEALLDDFYAQNIKPVKARLDACYMCRATPISDLRLLAETLLSCLRAGILSEPIPAAALPRCREAVDSYKAAEEESAVVKDA